MNNIHDLNSREFEVLAANYAKSIFPAYEWKITKAIGDYNRDFEAIVECLSKWGEAKHTVNNATSVSKSRWDPTLLSAILKNDVDELILVTSGWIPLEYVVRACHMANTTNTINKIIFINGYLVNEWLKTHEGDFCNFEVENVDLNSKKIMPIDYPKAAKCIIQVFDMYNILEPQEKLSAIIPYNIHITFFVISDSNVNVSIPDCFEIKSISYVNLSDKFGIPKTIPGKTISINTKQGYNQIIISGIGVYSQYSGNSNEIEVTINGVPIDKYSIIIKKPSAIDNKLTEQISKIEKERSNCLSSKVNSVVNVIGISRNDITFLSDKYQSFFFFNFNNSYCENAIELCKVLALLIFGIYNDQGEKKTVEAAINSTLNYCPTYLSKILIGTTDYIYAVETIKELLKAVGKYTTEKYNVPDKSTIFVEISNGSSPEVLKLLEYQLAFFKMQYNSSIVILSMKTDDNITCMQKTADVSELSLVDEIQNNTAAKDELLAQLQKIANKYYDSSDFFRAKFLYDIIFQNKALKDQNLYEIFKYADSLNHCDSLMRSKELFTIAAKMNSENDPKKEKKILEAQTELFSLRFWSLDVATLVDDIDKMMEEHSKILLNSNGDRALYAYYNCLNRKMVTQYLVGDYENAEITFDKYIKSIRSDNYMNYKAFAYMDSARGLYAKDLKVAKCRLIQSHELLKKLYKNGMESRRYLDCNVELAYVDFISEYEKGNDPNILHLESAVTQVRMKGYKSMLIKCNLKLAACYLALGNTKICDKCLNYVKGSCDFSENPRVKILYNNLLCGLLSVINNIAVKKYGIGTNCQSRHIITFNNSSKEKISIEPRLW